MDTTQLFDSFVYHYNPKNIAVDEICRDVADIDCCLISKYTDPTDLWDKITYALANSNAGCTIFIDTLGQVRPGDPVPYPVSVSLFAVSMAIYADIMMVNTGSSGSVIIKVYNKHIVLPKGAIQCIDFSRFNNRIASNLLCRTINLRNHTDIGWLNESLATAPVPGDAKVDIVFTLAGSDSPTDNEELRIALRSIDRHANDVGDVYIVTDNPPKWVTNVNVIHVPDIYPNNKDANLITKVLTACDVPELSERFIYWSDDQVLMQDADLKTLLPSYNTRGLDHFSGKDLKKWSNRMRHTLEVVKMHGGDVSHNWDSHVPQPIDKSRFKAIMSDIDFKTLPGLCINTAYFGLKGEPKQWCQNDVKLTYEKDTTCNYTFNKLFVGYNDSGYNAGLREALLERFSTPSKYEKN